jgi:hypothetical protein
MSYQLSAVTPVIPTLNIVLNMRFYASCGFEGAWLWTEDNQTIHDPTTAKLVLYAGFEAPVSLHLTRVESKAIPENTELRIQVAGEIEDFDRHCQRLNCLRPNAPLAQKPWESLEFSALDPSGVPVHFSKVIA